MEENSLKIYSLESGPHTHSVGGIYSIGIRTKADRIEGTEFELPELEVFYIALKPYSLPQFKKDLINELEKNATRVEIAGRAIFLDEATPRDVGLKALLPPDTPIIMIAASDIGVISEILGNGIFPAIIEDITETKHALPYIVEKKLERDIPAAIARSEGFLEPFNELVKKTPLLDEKSIREFSDCLRIISQHLSGLISDKLPNSMTQTDRFISVSSGFSADIADTAIASIESKGGGARNSEKINLVGLVQSDDSIRAYIAQIYLAAEAAGVTEETMRPLREVLEIYGIGKEIEEIRSQEVTKQCLRDIHKYLIKKGVEGHQK